MSGRIGYDPATANHQTAQFRVGEEFQQDGKTYRYVQFKEVDVVALAAGSCVQWVSNGLVTGDISASAAAAIGECAGVCVHAPTDDYFGFIQTGGYCPTITTDTNVIKTSALIMAADGVCGPAATSSVVPIFGMPAAADVSTTVAGWLNCG